MATNGEHVQSRGEVVLAVTTAMIACSTVFVVFRMISRVGIVKRVLWDDYFILLAWLLSFGLSFAICYGTSVGLGRHQKDIPNSWKPPLTKSQYTFSVLYNPALMATKTSILIFYLSLSKTQKVFRWASIATLAVVNIAGLALTSLNIFQCRPVGAAFETPVPSTAHCTDIVSIYLSSAPVNIITDLAILVLPMPVLTGMRLPRKQKTILVVTFGFGVFVAVVDVVRIAYLQEASLTRLRDVQGNTSSGQHDSRNNSDLSWYAALSFMWSAIEVNVGIMCACVPALKPLFSRFLPDFIRDPGEQDGSPRFGSVTNGSMNMAPAHRIPSAPDSPPKEREPAFNNADEPMGMMDFLTTPDMTDIPPCERTQTAMTNTTRHSQGGASAMFFDFVDMNRKKSMVKMTSRESIFPVLMVAILFFLWGFAYGLLDVLNAQFQIIAGVSPGQSVGLHSAYYGGYFVSMVTFGRLVLIHWGFKACFMVGLAIYACGTLVFWPSAVLTSFPAFLISNFIVGLGLSTLEIAANSFTVLCGPPQYGEIRLNLSQAFQAVGSVVSPLLAKKVLFRNVLDAPSLIDVQWTYLGIAFFTVILALVYHYVPLPEATDDELEEASQRADGANDAKIGGVRVIYITLGLGVLSQFCYVGGQEALSGSVSQYIGAVSPWLNTTNHVAVGHTAFAVSRFFAALINFFIKARRLLLFYYAGALIFAVLAMNYYGVTPAALLIMIYFFEGPIFSIIYGICLRGLGRRTKDGAALLTAAISGGAVFPPIIYAVAQHRDVQYAFCVVVAAFAVGIVLPVYLNVFPQAKRQVDPVARGAGGVVEGVDGRSPVSESSSSGKGSWIGQNFKRRRKEKDGGELPVAEHREGRLSPPALREV